MNPSARPSDPPTPAMKPPLFRIVLALLALAGFGLGSVGFHEANPSYSIPTAMLAAIQLFAFNSGVIEGRVPWQLEVARWAAVTFSIGALFEVALRLARGGFTSVSLWLQRTSLGRLWNQPLHVVVGLGQKGLQLAEDLRRTGVDVLAVDLDQGRVEQARARGLRALVADGTRLETHHLLPWHRLERMVLLMGGDEANLLGTLAARRAAGARSFQGTSAGSRFYAHVPTHGLRNLLYRQDVFAGGEVRLFNYYERLARRILLRYPVEALTLDPEPGRGTGFMEPEVGLQGVLVTEERAPQVYLRPSQDFIAPFVYLLARGSHLPHTERRRWRRIQVFLVDAEAERHVASLQEMYPALRRTGEMALIDFEPLIPAAGESPGQLIGRRIRDIPAGTPITVVLDVRDASRGLTEALTILDEARLPVPGGVPASGQTSAPALRCLFDFADEPAIRGLIDAHPCLHHYIRPLPSFSECCGRGNLYDDSMDRLARRIHENYDREGSQPWERLSLEHPSLSLQQSDLLVRWHLWDTGLRM